MSSTGYGPSSETRWSRLTFDGNEENYELWETKFLEHMRLLKLKDTILPPDDKEPDKAKNADCYAELIQCLDDKSLALVMRDAPDDGQKALQLLRGHYANQSKPRIITLYTELTSLEKTITALRNAKETLSDGLIIAMILKGLPDNYKPFAIHVTQSASEITFAHFKSMLRSFEETEKFHAKPIVEQIMKAEASSSQTMTCYGCGKTGHLVRDCPGKSVKTSKWCSYHKSTTHTDSTCKSQ